MKITLTRSSILLLLFYLFIACSYYKDEEDEVQSFELEKTADENSNCILIPNVNETNSPAIEVKPASDNTGVVIWEKGYKQDWSKGKYLVLEIFGDNDYSGTINIEFYKEKRKSAKEKIVLQSGEVSLKDKDTPWFSSLMGILPKLKTKVVFPLSYLDAQTLFVNRFPRQLKGTINGNRLDTKDITKVILRFGPYFGPYFQPKYLISSIYISNEKPELYQPIDAPIIDKFGQWKLKDWKWKVHSEDELVSRGLELRKNIESEKFPENWSKYGGWKEKKFESTGYFRTHHDGKRWWFVDPDGYAFLSVGVDCFRKTSLGPIEGIEDLFDWLPNEGDTLFPVLSKDRNKKKSMDFYISNMIRVFGKDWERDWEIITAGLMKRFRINTIGNWSDLDFAKKINAPYVLPMRDFPSTNILLYRDFPDVFSEEYKINSGKFAYQLIVYKDDPFMIGYFLRNEPHWAFGYHNLAYEMFGTNHQSATKDEFVKWISKKYSDEIKLFNKSWELNLKNFEDLKLIVLKDYPSEIADSDFYKFSEIMVKKYVDIPCDEVEKVDNDHLNLGMRYAWLSSDLLYKAGERFDVFSINGYGISPPPTAEIAQKSGKPIMIGEFHHGAVDRGLPATGIIGVLSQEDRANAYRNYIEQGFAKPELVGMHYFQWIDQPFYGRFDGENYNIGIVDITNQPYDELTKAMTITNQRIYEIGNGQIIPYKKEVINVPPIHY